MNKIKYIKHNQIDFEKWDHTVLQSELPLVFAQSFYLNATCPNWNALVIGDYESIFPLTSKTKFGIKYLPQPHFTSQLGAYGIVTIEIEQLFHDYINKNFSLIEIELNATNKIQTPYINSKKTYIIDYKKLYSYNQNTKRNLKKAKEFGLTVTEIKQKDILHLSKKWLNPFLEHELRLSKSVVKTFNSLLANSMLNHNLLSYAVLDRNKEIRAIAHFVFNNKYALYLKGTNFDKEENTGSMHLLLDTAITHFKNYVHIFDFGGGGSKGLASFYQGLGGTQLIYNTIKINKLPKLVTLFKGKI